VITGIIIALSDEISSITNKKINTGDCIFINDNTLVACSGAGPQNAAKASELLIKKGAKRLISWGCAAALSDCLISGDLVLPTHLQAENKKLISIKSPWHKHVKEQLTALKINTGLLTESSAIVTQSSAKRLINKQSNAIALDMESIAVAQTAKQHDLPVLVIRSIADPVWMSLPKAVSYSLDNQGEAVLNKLLWFLLTHPTELPGLIKLGIHFNAAKNKLKLVAKQLDKIVSFESKTNN